MIDPSKNNSRYNPSSQQNDPYSVSNLKVPPHSIEAEQAVLGGLMLSNESWDLVVDKVSEIDFYRQDHRLIFRVMGELADRSEPRDVVTLSEHLKMHNELDKAGGAAYLATLAKDIPSAANIVAYCDIVRQRSVLRQLIAVGERIANSAYVPEGRSVKELLDVAEAEVFKITDQDLAKRNGFQSIKELLTEAVDKIDELFNNDNPITGVTTGFEKFDEMTSGMQPSDLIIVAGRPSMGKTTFAMNLAENAAIKDNLPVAVFSMEMSGSQLAMRMISSLGRINQQNLRSGKLDDSD